MLNISPTMRGIILMLLGVSLLSSMDACVKWLVQRDVSVIQIMAMRGWLHVLVLLLLLPRRGGFKSVVSKQYKLHFLRTAIGFFAPLCFFLSLKYLPIADATAIFFCATFFMVAGSKYFLGEQVGVHRWAAVVVGFMGVLLVSSPGGSGFHPASLLAMASGASYAVIIVLGRVMVKKESPFILVFYFSGLNALVATLLVPFFWGMPSTEEMGMMLLLATLALGGYFALTTAFSLAPISVIAPMEYIALIWATLLGYFIWQEIPTGSTWAGMGLILSAGLYIIWRESQHKIKA